ncbi:MAG: glutathione S-transferase family protein [Hyphomonadaceae bacterium]|nr:glutathione S-transferase family protein [Hyphomonadaceae bacterium]
MKLYIAPYAPNPRRATMFVAEKGITDIEFVSLNLPAGEHRTDAFRKLSPLSQIPTLELDDGRALTESRAICAYLEALYPEPNMMGRDPFERAQIEMWDRRTEYLVVLPFMLWMRHGFPALAAVEKNQNPAVAAYYETQAKTMAHWFDRQLADREWIAGDRFTIADITAACGIDFAKMAKWRPDDTLPNLKRWRDAIAQRPAGQAAP